MTLVLAYAMMMAVSELQACDAHLLLSRVNVGCALLLALLWCLRQLAQRLAQLQEAHWSQLLLPQLNVCFMLAYAIMMAVSERRPSHAELQLACLNSCFTLLMALYVWGCRQREQQQEERQRRAMLQQAWQGMLAAVTPLLEGAPGAALAAQRG
jgi:hypothetical protein